MNQAEPLPTSTLPTFAELLAKVRRHYPHADLDELEKAYIFAEKAHQGQTRASGEPYIHHPLAAACILADLSMDLPTLQAALLHDVVEDTPARLSQIKEQFGDQVALLVDGVTKLTAISRTKVRHHEQGKTQEEGQAENLRKIFLAMARDIRVILIKLADRLHNLRTLEYKSAERRAFIARETLEIFAPIASRLGIWQLKWELEDLAFHYLEPEAYQTLVRLVNRKRVEREKGIEQVIATLGQRLAAAGVEARMEGRPKHLYSIHTKMTQKGRTFEEIYDLIAIRIVVPNLESCYAALGVVHSMWMPVTGRFKDYIAKPKPNNYRSLHTTVFGPDGEPLEIQIRDPEMHAVDEFGIAAHWAYKEQEQDPGMLNLSRDIYPWIKSILEWQADSRDASEYIENLKLDLLDNQVFVFSPGGDVFDLPAGSTPIDFAYRVHTQVGHACTGAKVNGRIVPLGYTLQNSDIIEIITSKHSNPSLDWLNVVKSSHARKKIQAWFKKERRDENIIRGREMLDREFRRQRLDGLDNRELLLERVSDQLHFRNFDDMLASIGYGETNLPQIFNRLKDLLPQELAPAAPQPMVRAPRKSRAFELVRVKGIDNVLVRFSHCCSPVPGDDICGYITLGQGISIHRADCPNLALLRKQPERLIEVEWSGSAREPEFGVELELEAWDRPGLLSEIMNLVNEAKLPCRSCRAWARGARAQVKLGVDVKDREQLEWLIQRLLQLPDIIEVQRKMSRGLHEPERKPEIARRAPKRADKRGRIKGGRSHKGRGRK